MSTVTEKKANNQLSDGRSMRGLDGSVNQRQMFDLRGKFNPKVEGVAKVKDVDDAMNMSRIFSVGTGNHYMVRTDEYVIYHKDPDAPLGKELLWIDNGVLYRKVIPDLPVLFNGREISLQKVACGVGIYDSIGLLKIEQTGEKEFTVSPIDFAALAGKIRAMKFRRNEWAEPDEYGFPDADRYSSHDNPRARFGAMRARFERDATGWHGSVACYGYQFRFVVVGDKWSNDSEIAIVSR